MFQKNSLFFPMRGVNNDDPSKQPPPPNKGKNKNSGNSKPPAKKKRSSLSRILWAILIVWIVVLVLSLIFVPNPRQLTIEQMQVLATTGSIPSGVTVEGSVYLYSDVFYLVLNFSDKVTMNGVVFEKGLYSAYWPYAWQSFVLIQNLASKGVNLTVGVQQTPFIVTLLLSWLPWILFFVLGWFIIKTMFDRQGNQMGFGKSNAKPEISNINFDDVAGYREIKTELQELVDFLKEPAKFARAGARTPKGVLLSGPPGTGKTLFAKAIAGEAGIPFFSISGSDFVEMFVGVGASRVRSLFKTAKATAPAVIFIDELDAVGRRRGSNSGGQNDEREQTLNQLLVEMDGFVSNSGIIVIAATNRPDVLDPALKRPGRFDREIQLRLPDIKEREEILRRHSRGKRFSSEIVWNNIAKRTPGFSGAELENVLNESAILAIRDNSQVITINEIDEAIDRVIGGPSKSNNVMSFEEKKLVSYHEAGHALIGLMLEHAQKVQKISIVPRGDAGGYVLMTPKREKFIQTKSELLAQITSYLGGRVSEEIFFGKGEITTGAYSDIEEATKIARRMITEFGMSSLGPIQFHKHSDYDLYGQPVSQDLSEKLRQEIDAEVSKIIKKSYDEAYKIISENKDLIEVFAEALILKETLNMEEIEQIFKTKTIPQEFYDLSLLKEEKKLFPVSEFKSKSGITYFANKATIERLREKEYLEEMHKQQMSQQQQQTHQNNETSVSPKK